MGKVLIVGWLWGVTSLSAGSVTAALAYSVVRRCVSRLFLVITLIIERVVKCYSREIVGCLKAARAHGV
jgi:hypothetical protein